MSLSKELLLCGDIGGTKALISLNEVVRGERQARRVFKKRYECRNYSTFSALLSAVLADGRVRGDEIKGGCLAVAAPLLRSRSQVKLTNLPWHIDTQELSRELGVRGLTLCNDLYAAAAGIEVTEESSLVELQRGVPDVAAVRIVIGVGTGLGMAQLAPYSGGWCVVPGEVGHAGFAPGNRLLGDVWLQLSQSVGRVRNEEILSGHGIATLYRLLGGSNADSAILGSSDPAAVIAQSAVADPEGLCRKTMDVFFSAYGGFAGDMALTMLATGGVYLTGGITVKNLDLLKRGPFLEAFNSKDEQSALTRRIPIMAVNNLELGLRGAELLAMKARR